MMKVKVIKRAEHERATAEVSAVAAAAANKLEISHGHRDAAMTVKKWIDELDEKREHDRQLFRKLFLQECCS